MMSLSSILHSLLPAVSRYALVAILLLLAVLAAASAQAQPVRQLATGFERDVNRYRWTSDARFELRVAGWEVGLVNRFVSDGYILFDDRLRFRDEDRLEWEAERPLDADSFTISVARS